MFVEVLVFEYVDLCDVECGGDVVVGCCGVVFDVGGCWLFVCVGV